MNLKHSLLIALSLGTFAAFSAETVKNFVNNGDMTRKETNQKDLLGWAYPKDAKIVQVAGHPAVEFKGGLSQWGMTLAPGKYRLRFSILKNNSNWLGVRLFCRDMANQEIKDSSELSFYIKGDVIPKWTAREYVFTVPQNKNCGLIFSTHGGVMTIGDISLTRVETPAGKSK